MDSFTVLVVGSVCMFLGGYIYNMGDADDITYGDSIIARKKGKTKVRPT